MCYRIFLLVAMFITYATSSSSQRVHLNLFGGIANYKGDLQYNAKGGKQISFKQPKFAAGIGMEYELSDKLSLRLAFTSAKIHADDKKQPGQEQRNLNFTSSIFDVMLGAQYYIIDPTAHRVSPYVFAGVGYFHYNPYTFDAAGEKVLLQPLNTEGQGFVEGRDPYKLSQFSIPFGGGIKFPVSDNLRIGVEISLRKTFTDYLDDVSTAYVDQAVILANKGQTTLDYAYRGDEVNAGPYPADGTPRGTLQAKDWYYFTGLTISYRLGNGGGGGGGGRRSKVGCPTSVR